MHDDKVIHELGKIADQMTQILTKRMYSISKEEKKRLTIIRDEINLFISDYMYRDEIEE
ncbi:MAG: hypothetical protein OH335_04860 [Candidatus Parvarchaeota archaeon]|nr:hypothetical protein [Candidatus Jingweiarchaeum tengchongense]MCW1306077.1 hypothetical protein [Candidatus Jingweiarchaeum tengchongense]